MTTTEGQLLALSVGYAAAADRRNAAAFVSVFSPDARLHVSAAGAPDRIVRTYAGHDELAEVPVRLARYHRTYHLLGQVDLRVDGATATGEVHCVAHHLEQQPTGWADRVLLIRYADTYVVDGGWRIAERTVRIAWAETRPADAPEAAE